MTTITSLTADSDAITSLEGLEYCTGLTYLELESNNFTDLSPLSGLTGLGYLDLSFNSQISDISGLTGLTGLYYLRLNYDSISNVSDLSGLTGLQTLILGSNSISNISALSGLTQLTTLDVDTNQVTDLSPIAGMTNLHMLDVISNGIQVLPNLSGLTQLNYLYADANQITDLSPVQALTGLYGLYLNDNQISSIPDLSGLTNLDDLEVDNNQITDISGLANCNNLYYLNLSNNKITDLSVLVNNTSLVNNGAMISLGGNPLGSGAWLELDQMFMAANTGWGSPAINFGTISSPTQSVWRVLADSTASYTDCNNNVWSWDENYSSGSSFCAVRNGPIANALPCPSDWTLYNTEHCGQDFTYTFSVPAGNYQVTLKFAENYDLGVGERLLNVSLNGAQVLHDLDVYSEVGGYTADDKVFTNIAPNGNGKIVIEISAPDGWDTNAQISSIEIIPQP
jgi:hypothetical protein